MRKKHELANLDDDGLFSESIVLDSQQVEESFFETLSFHCLDCVEWGMVRDHEVFNRHQGHDLDLVHPIHLRNGDRLVYRSNYFNVDRKETQNWSLDEKVQSNSR